MKKFKYRISIVLVVAIICSFSISTSAFAIKDQNSLLINTNQPHIQQFEVASLNTITGVETTKQYNTSLTANALSRGITEMSTPAHIGSDPLLYNSEDGLYNSITPQGIVGSDNRIRVTSPQSSFPYRAICRIVTYWDKNNDGVIDNVVGVGTGFLEGPSAVVTAGHCIYDAGLNMWCKYAEVTFAQNGPGSAPYDTIRSTTIHTSTAWINSGDSNQDWAVVEVGSAIGNRTGWFGKMWTSGSLNGTSITVTGYPGDIATSINDKNNPNVQGKGTYMWYCKGTITNSLSARLEYDADTWGGNSGGPVYNSSNQVLAIHTYGVGSSANGGTRITEWLYNFLVQFQS